ncbi:MAG: tetratricopeptide repeat protein [Anaerolineae bacterium]|nr:tetratricopeptide repeat protein [Anaerolineae bacterium]
MSHQRVLLDETWLASLLMMPLEQETKVAAVNIQRQASKQQAMINLPMQATPFIGRTAELADIDNILANPACRLLTLLGPGGVGKTRLALEFAARHADKFSSGTAFIPLASVGTPAHVASAIADRLSLNFAGQSDPIAFLLGYLSEHQMLLILDNFEHLLEGTGTDLILKIIQHAPQITLLVTSRERLNLQVEWLFDVEGLSYPSGKLMDVPPDVTDYSAVQLFVQRIKQVQPSFSPSESALRSIVQMSQQLAGMPLAIELAAATVRIHSIDMVEQHLRENLGALSTTLRDVPERHRSMRAAFDHSWSLLNEPDRVIFSRLAIFHGSFTAEAAKQVSGAMPYDLGALIDKSLLRQSQAQAVEATATSELRFFMLEPIYEYALERLLERGEYEKLQHSHAAYYLALVEDAAAHWNSRTAEGALSRVSREYDNIHAALAWSRASSHPTIGLQIVVALTPFWQVRGFSAEIRGWLADLLALDAHNQNSTSMAVRVRALNCAAILATDKSDFADAARLLKESLAIRHTLGETGNETSLLINASLQARAVGQYQRATVLIEDALAERRSLGNPGGIAEALHILGLVLREQGELDGALTHFQESLTIRLGIGDRGSVAQAQLALGDVARDRGEVLQMRQYSEESLAVFREFGTQWAIGFALNNLAYAAYLEGDLAQAVDLASESVSVFRAIERRAGLGESLITLGNVLREQGKVAAADESLTEALQLVWVNGPRLFVAVALEGLASTMAQIRQIPLSVRLLGAASALREQMGTPIRPSDQPMVEQTLVFLRAAIGADTFQSLWAEARSQPLEQVVNHGKQRLVH